MADSRFHHFPPQFLVLRTPTANRFRLFPAHTPSRQSIQIIWGGEEGGKDNVDGSTGDEGDGREEEERSPASFGVIVSFWRQGREGGRGGTTRDDVRSELHDGRCKLASKSSGKLGTVAMEVGNGRSEGSRDEALAMAMAMAMEGWLVLHRDIGTQLVAKMRLWQGRPVAHGHRCSVAHVRR